MSPDDPRHGTIKGVWAHGNERSECCPPCLQARRAYNKRREYARAAGRPGRVPLGEHNHTKLLQARQQGWTFDHIADDLGISTATVHLYINKGPGVMVLPGRHQELRMWHPDQPITGIGVRRRLEALTWLGYPAAELARRTGHCEMTFSEGLRFERVKWRANVTEAIGRLYRELWDTPNEPTDPYDIGAAKAAHRRAEKRGYAPPMAWNNIDDATEKPTGLRRHWHTGPGRNELDHAVVTRILSGERVKATRAEKDEATRRWVAAGNSKRSLAHMQGWNDGRMPSQGEAA